jgi:UDP-N-acetylglucosamine--N-acetylmuramyl-(pentapeptide) pyrophosphoryl-undecaprenol N-acetylglucosamine transferase
MGMEMRIIIAGGGTGGHLFPGIAIAEEFLKRDQKNEILFIGTERGIEKRVLGNGKMRFPLRTIDVEGVKGRSLIKTISALLKIPHSLIQSYRLIREFSPDIVIGVGGYASGPAVMAAHFMGIKTAIAEQNALPGVTNRILGKFVDRIFLTFSDTKNWFPEGKTIFSGNPIRSAFFTENGNGKKFSRKFTLLIFGGSQGAHSINMAIRDALPYLQEIKSAVKIIHQTGSADMDSVSAYYRSSGFDAEVLPFITDMAQAYRSSDLLICRAGATSIAEITVSGKASILIPFPFATNDHQTKNAEALVKAGAAVMLPESDLSGKKLSEIIEHIYKHPEILRDMEKKSASLGNKKAASDIVGHCIAMVT